MIEGKVKEIATTICKFYGTEICNKCSSREECKVEQEAIALHDLGFGIENIDTFNFIMNSFKQTIENAIMNCANVSPDQVWIFPKEEKHGYWIPENSRPKSSQFLCSECRGRAYYPQPSRVPGWKKRCPYKLCPNCGAIMDGGKEQ